MRKQVFLLLIVLLVSFSYAAPANQGDVDGNGYVDILDLTAVITSLGIQTNAPAHLDQNDDGKLDLFDLVLVAKNWRRNYAGIPQMITPQRLLPMIGPLVAQQGTDPTIASIDARYLTEEAKWYQDYADGKADYDAGLITNVAWTNNAHHYGALGSRLAYSIRTGAPTGPAASGNDIYSKGREIIQSYYDYYAEPAGYSTPWHWSTGLLDEEVLYVLDGNQEVLNHLNILVYQATRDPWGRYRGFASPRPPALALQLLMTADRLDLPLNVYTPSYVNPPTTWQEAARIQVDRFLYPNPDLVVSGQGARPMPPLIRANGSMPSPPHSASWTWPEEADTEAFLFNAMSANSLLDYYAYYERDPAILDGVTRLVDHLINSLPNGWTAMPYTTQSPGPAPDLAGYYVYPSLVLWQETGDQKYYDFAMLHLAAVAANPVWGSKQFNQMFGTRLQNSEALLVGVHWKPPTPLWGSNVTSCIPSNETCNGQDDDCDGQIDEGVLNACGVCGPVPPEVCDQVDNDCNGQVDEGVTNACGTCGPVPVEVCDQVDNNCDGQIDEGGVCAPQPTNCDVLVNGSYVCFNMTPIYDNTWNGVYDHTLRMVGPQHVYQGHSLWINGWGTHTDPRDYVYMYAENDMPPGVTVHWVTPAISCCGGNRLWRPIPNNRIEIRTSPTTPPGKYVFVFKAVSGGVSKFARHEVYVEATPGPLPTTPVTSTKPIPQFSQWEANMLSYGNQHCDEQNILQLGMWDGSVQYYDGMRVYHQIAQYTNDNSWYSCSDYVAAVYQPYVINNQGSVPGYRVFPDGSYMDYVRTGNTNSYDAVVFMGNGLYTGYCQGCIGTTSIRETSYAINALQRDEDVGEPRNQYYTTLVDFGIGHFDQLARSNTSLYFQPFMAGLMMESLIREYERSGDPRIPPTIKIVLDELWDRKWDPINGSLGYTQINGSHASTLAHRDLNMLIAPAYSWMYKMTGDPIYRDRGDLLFENGVEGAWLAGGKQFSQNYRWSFDYVKWRQEAEAGAS